MEYKMEEELAIILIVLLILFIIYMFIQKSNVCSIVRNKREEFSLNPYGGNDKMKRLIRAGVLVNPVTAPVVLAGELGALGYNKYFK